MTTLSRELVFLILQFLDEEKFKETVHKLEKESGFFFNMSYFEEAVTNGEWDEVEKYLLGFTKLDDNRHSMKMFFEIRKQKYLEALDRNDQGKSVEILVKDLKVFSTFNEELFKEITLLLTLPNFRENEQLSKYGDTKSARAIMLAELKKLIEVNPLLCDKLQFPGLRNSRLRTLINQSLNWQHQLCKNPKPNPDIKTLFIDHSCAQPNGALAPSPVANPITGSMPKVGVSPPLGAHGIPYPLAPPPIASLGGWMANAPSMSHQAVSGGSIVLSPPANAVASVLNRPMMTPTNIPALDYQTADSEECHAPSLSSSDDLPKTAVVNLNQRSAVKSVDFNPTEAALQALEESVAGNQKTVKLPPTERTITVSLPDDVNLLHLPGKDVKFLLPLVGPLEKAQLDRQDTDVLVSQLICQTLRSHLTSMEVLKRVQLLSGADGQLQAEVERLKAENKGLKAENEALTKVHDSATHSRGLLQKMQDQESYFTTELSKLTGQIDALDDKVQEKEEDVVRITQELAAAETKVRSLDELARANGAERDRLQVAYDKLAKELEEAQELVKDLTYASDHL